MRRRGVAQQGRSSQTSCDMMGRIADVCIVLPFGACREVCVVPAGFIVNVVPPFVCRQSHVEGLISLQSITHYAVTCIVIERSRVMVYSLHEEVRSYSHRSSHILPLHSTSQPHQERFCMSRIFQIFASRADHQSHVLGVGRSMNPELHKSISRAARSTSARV